MPWNLCFLEHHTTIYREADARSCYAMEHGIAWEVFPPICYLISQLGFLSFLLLPSSSQLLEAFIVSVLRNLGVSGNLASSFLQ